MTDDSRLTESDRKLLESFYNDQILVERKSKLSADTYVYSVCEFMLWCNKRGIQIANVNTQTLLYYLAFRKDNDISDQTIAKDISSLRAFGTYQKRMGKWQENFALELEKPKTSKTLPKVLSIEQVDAFLDAIDVNKPLGIRDRALFELIYSCGLRISEASTLLMTNIHFEEKILIVHGKEDKERIVPFGTVAEEWLKKWLTEARPIIVGQKSVNEVFVNSRGAPLSRKGIWKNFQIYEEKSGVNAKVHTLRHSFATHLLAGGADLRTVQELLGHADLSTTVIYTHIENEELKQYHSGYFPGHVSSGEAEGEDILGPGDADGADDRNEGTDSEKTADSDSEND